MKPVNAAHYLRHIGARENSGESGQRDAPAARRPVLAIASAAPQRAPMFRVLGEAAPRPGAAPAATAPPAPDPRIEDAYARGLRDGAAQAEAESARQREAESAARREQDALEREAFHREEYAALSNVIGARLVEAEARIGAGVARILAPYVEAREARAILDALVAALRRIAAGGAGPLLRISGPERLLAPLRARVADLACAIEAREGEEIVVEAGDARIETQFAAFAALLQGDAA